VLYADGEREEAVLALERVRLLLRPGERLQPPTCASLVRLAKQLRDLAQQPQHRKAAADLRRRAREVEEAAQERDVAEAAAIAASTALGLTQRLALGGGGGSSSSGATTPAGAQGLGAAGLAAGSGSSGGCGDGGLPPSVARGLALAELLPPDTELKGVHCTQGAAGPTYGFRVRDSSSRGGV
jgi:hypothetical protein